MTACFPFLLAFLAATELPTSPTGPNLAIVLLDDLGTDFAGAYPELPQTGPVPSTPNLDVLATQGALFWNCWVNPLCSPTRATLLTGEYAQRTGFGALAKEDATWFLPVGQYWPRVLRDHGLQTVQVGKWHLGTRDELLPLDAVLYGFEIWAGTKRNFDGGGYENWTQSLAWPWYAVPYSGTTYITSQTVDDALLVQSFLQEPWVEIISFNAVHRPVHWPPQELHSFVNGVGEKIDEHAAMVEALDTELGRLVAGMDLTNTIVMILGDNGTQKSWRTDERGKNSLYESGIRVPFIVIGAGVTPGVRTALVNGTDFAATILELRGLAPPPETARDSVSFLPALREPDWQGRTVLYSEFFTPNGGEVPLERLERTARDERWKLIRFYTLDAAGSTVTGWTDEWYDVPNDPDEVNPIPESQVPAAVVAALTLLVNSKPQDGVTIP